MLTSLYQTSLPIQVAATPSNFGKYDAFLYKDWRYPLDARNKLENRNKTNQEVQTRFRKQPLIGKIEILVEPKYLCFLAAGDKVEWSKVSDWTEQNSKRTPTSYVFVSFTGEHLKNGKLNDKYIRDVGKHVAKAIRVSAYWISSSCLYNIREKDEQKWKLEKQETSWSISDIIREQVQWQSQFLDP